MAAIFFSMAPDFSFRRAVGQRPSGRGLATYEAARESLERLKSFGINYRLHAQLRMRAGVAFEFSEILRAADDVGMLVASLSTAFQPLQLESGRCGRKQRLRAACGVLRARRAGIIPQW